MDLPVPFRLRARRAGPIAALLLATLAPCAHAQYSWIDASGTRVFSDRPPPPGTPPARILKSPRPIAAAPYGAAASAPPALAPAAPSPAPDARQDAKRAPPTLAEREAEFRARAARQKEAEAKAEKEAQQQKARRERCKGLKRNEMTLTAGTRLSEFDERGERHYLGDEERARRLAGVRRAQAAECR